MRPTELTWLYLKKENEHSIALANVLKEEKSELGVGNARLTEENEKLEIELKALKESHNQLLGQLVKEKASLSINVASSNPCCEHANLVEENVILKAQL